MYALTHGTLYTGADVLPNHSVFIDGTRIQAIHPTSSTPPDCAHLNLQGLRVSPGFIDLQLNGCGGVMFNDAITAQTLAVMHRTNCRSGTTSFLPTLITTSDRAMTAAMACVHDYRQQYPYQVLGLHLEGPYLNPKRRGIHDGHYVRSPDAAMVAAIATYGPETVRLVTLAPERVPAETIQTLVAAGITVAAGHTDATYAEALAGFDAGITMVTHLFNAMSPWQSRHPGMVGAALSQPSVYAGIIADGHHVHVASIALAKQLKGEHLILVTDATPPAGMSSMDAFTIGGQTVFYRDGKCLSAAGTLGGSALTMNQAIANCLHHSGISLEEALRMATLYPARAMGMEHELGALAPGYQANLAIFDDELTIQGVVDQGQLQRFTEALTTEVAMGSPIA